MSIAHWLVVLVVVVLLFGRNGRIPKTMGDIGKGIREFKAGLSGEKIEARDESPVPPPQIVNKQDENNRSS
jgi:sec-independent protein translocase protein TatA